MDAPPEACCRDVIIVGGGPAGLSAALILGRCRRHVLVIDAGSPRNARSHALHGFLSRDCIDPGDMRRIATEQLSRYDTVEFRIATAAGAERISGGFRVTFHDGSTEMGRVLLLATGVIDVLPEVDGLAELYGTSVFHCPYCDGWEVRDRALGAYGRGEQGAGFALELTGWSRDVVLFTDGGGPLPAKVGERLARNGVLVREEPILRLAGKGGKLEKVVLAGGDEVPRSAFFFRPEQLQRSPLAQLLGCDVTEGGVVETGKFQVSAIPGLYIAGDAARSVQLAVVAAAEGAEAAFAINTALLEEDLP